MGKEWWFGPVPESRSSSQEARAGEWHRAAGTHHERGGYGFFSPGEGYPGLTKSGAGGGMMGYFYGAKLFQFAIRGHRRFRWKTHRFARVDFKN